MTRRKTGSVRRDHGAMCRVCGLNSGKGGALKRHVERAHDVTYSHYKTCFEGAARNIIVDAWNSSGRTVDGTPVIIHVLVRRFVRDPGNRGVPMMAKASQNSWPSE